MTDPAEDLVNTIHDQETARRRDLLEHAAHEARWRDASIASRLIPVDDVATSGDAYQAVKAYTAEHPEHARPAEPAQITEAEQTRQWGEDMLRGMGIEPSGRQ